MNYSIDQLHLLTLNVGYACHNADWNWKNVRSPFARLFLVTEGCASIDIGNQNYTLTPGHLYFIPAYTRHSYTCTCHFCHYYLHIYENNDNEESFIEDFTFPVEIESQPSDEELMKRLCTIYPFLKLPESNPESYNNYQTLVNNLQLNSRCCMCDNIEARGIIYILMSHFFKYAHQQVDIQDDRIANTLRYIRRHLNQTIEIDDLAKRACMSKDHFIRLFKQYIGTTPNVYITRKKIEKAELLLVTTNQPIKFIAETLGYIDNSYFNRIFKKNIGITPQQYRMKR